MSLPDRNLNAAESVAAILQDHGIDAVVIGAIALAAHHYVRYTEDIDLGISTSLESCREASEFLRQAGFDARFREPDADDPLSGVIDVIGSFGTVQVINFGQTFPAVIDDAFRNAKLTVRPGSQLRLAPLPQLIALKLYSGGLKSKADIAEVLTRNPDADFDEIRNVCQDYRLRGLEAILRELGKN